MERDRKLVLIATIALTGALAVLSVLLPAERPAERPDTPFAESVVASAPEIAVEPIRRPVWRTKLGRRGTLGDALDRLGLAPEARARFLELATREIDPRRLSPRTGVSVVEGDGPVPFAVCIRPAEPRFLRVRFAEAGGTAEPTIEWVEMPIETHVAVSGGIVETSVAQALSDEGHGRLLPHAFADVVQWDVDLLVDPRPGDEVRMVYEVRTLGESPYDAPPFGDKVGDAGNFLGLGRVLAASYRGKNASAVAYWVERGDGSGDYFDEDGRPLRKTFLKSPLNYRRISSGFSHARRNPVTRKVVPHHGVDFAAAAGTPVASTADGTVVSAGWSGALGRAVKIRHGSEYVTVYGHLSRIARGVRSGASVRQGDVIGYVGATGRATGPHLHYSMIVGGQPINPLRFDNPAALPLEEKLRPALEASMRAWRPILDSIDPSGPSMDVARSADRPPPNSGI